MSFLSTFSFSVLPIWTSQEIIIYDNCLHSQLHSHFLNLWNEYLFEALFRLNLAISIKYWRQSWIACILLYYAMWLVQNFTLSAEHDQLELVKTWKTRPFEVMHRSSWSLNTSSPRATHKHLTVVLAWGLGISTLPYLQKLSSLSSVKTRLIF